MRGDTKYVAIGIFRERRKTGKITHGISLSCQTFCAPVSVCCEQSAGARYRQTTRFRVSCVWSVKLMIQLIGRGLFAVGRSVRWGEGRVRRLWIGAPNPSPDLNLTLTPPSPLSRLIFPLAQRTAPTRPASSQGQEQGPGLVTDGTQLPFDGAAGAYGDASVSEGKSLHPKSVDA